MIDRIKKVKELIIKLDALVTEQGKPLNQNDKHVTQSLYNIHHYIQSNVYYDASSQIEMIRFKIDGCTEEIKALVSPLLSEGL